jgi:hypothetical protein
MKLEGVFLDDRAVPYATDEVALADKVPGRLDQKLQDLEGAVSKLDRCSPRP